MAVTDHIGCRIDFRIGFHATLKRAGKSVNNKLNLPIGEPLSERFA